MGGAGSNAALPPDIYDADGNTATIEMAITLLNRSSLASGDFLL